MAVRIIVFSLTLLLAPVWALAWVRFVWQELNRPDMTATELLWRSALVAAAGLIAYLVLRLVGAVAGALARGIERLAHRHDRWAR